MKTKLAGIGIFFSILILCNCSSSTGGSKVDTTSPATPSGIQYTASDGAIIITWEPVRDNNLEGYNVYWLENAEVDTLNANRLFVTTNSATITDLDYDKKYYFAVTSLDKSGNESPMSVQEWAIPGNTTAPAAPEGLDIVAENTDSVKITVYWAENTEPDFDHYNIYRATIKKGLEEIKRVSKKNATIIISALKRSSKIHEIESNITKLFSLENKITEDIDVIYVIKNK